MKYLTAWQSDGSAIALYLVLVALAAVYVWAARLPSPRGRPWPPARIVWFLAGLALLAVAYGSGLQTYEDQPAVHVVQHMLVMMAVPPLLVFGAPLTLTLRTLPPDSRRSLVRELQDPAFRPLTGRWAPVFLSVDYYLTMYLYQLTPIHSFTEQHPLAHFAIHQYFLLCGLLFWLPIAGVDPVRFRPSARTKQVMIWLGVPAFAVLGAIELAKGDTATGWAYVATGIALTAFGGALVAARSRVRRGPLASPRTPRSRGESERRSDGRAARSPSPIA